MITKFEIEIKEGEPNLRVYSMHSLAKALCNTFSITKEEFFNRDRSSYLTTPRHAFYYLAHKYCNQSTPKIGRFMNGRDHTTIIHGKKKCAAMKAKNDKFALKLEEAHLLALEFEKERTNQIEDMRNTILDRVEEITGRETYDI
jgi:chromosomal replication initiation ATPase DnaA